MDLTRSNPLSEEKIWIRPEPTRGWTRDPYPTLPVRPTHWQIIWPRNLMGCFAMPHNDDIIIRGFYLGHVKKFLCNVMSSWRQWNIVYGLKSASESLSYRTISRKTWTTFSMRHSTHCLNHLLPPIKSMDYVLRNSGQSYILPHCNY